MNFIKWFLGTYFLLGGFISFVFYLNSMGLKGIYLYLVPSMLSFGFILYFIATGAYIISNSNRLTGFRLAVIGLLIQSFQFSLVGVLFKNYFGAYLGIGNFADLGSGLEVNFRFFDMRYGNGFKTALNESYIYINIIPVLILLLCCIYLQSIFKDNNKEHLTFK